MSTKEFSTDWFLQNILIWEKILIPLMNKPIEALEIGSFEGRSTVWLLEHILTHPQAHITCVDSFSSKEELKDADWDKIKARFLLNLAGFEDKYTLYVSDSASYLKKCTKQFDFIYVDGSHLASDVLIDAVLSHMLLKPEGIIIFDDWLWSNFEKRPDLPKPAIDAFLECFGKEYQLLNVGYQIALQKRM